MIIIHVSCLLSLNGEPGNFKENTLPIFCLHYNIMFKTDKSNPTAKKHLMVISPPLIIYYYSIPCNSKK